MTSSVTSTYDEVHRYDGAAIQNDRRSVLVPCAIQPRDVGLLRDVWQHKFLSAPQLAELWWPNSSAWAAQRRLLKLFDAGLLERFRPIARRGTFAWTYHLGEAGHFVLRSSGVIDPNERYRRRAVYDFGHVLHELQVNAWVLACRRVLGDALQTWGGETDIIAPRHSERAQLRLGDGWSVEGLRDPQPRLLRPDAVLEVGTGDQQSRTLFIEFDRTQRIDKNYGKFRRYDCFLNSWWRQTAFSDSGRAPYVIFVCPNDDARERFLEAADRELVGHRWHPSAPAAEHEHVGRRRVLFAVEQDAHEGRLEALRLPALPPGHDMRDARVTRTRFGAA